MANAVIAVLIALMVGVIFVMTQIVPSVNKATTPYALTMANGSFTFDKNVLDFGHQNILNGTESCFNATDASDVLTRDVNYTMDYWNGKLTNLSISPAWATGKFNCSAWYGDPSYTGKTGDILSIKAMLTILIVGLLVFLVKGVGLI